MKFYKLVYMNLIIFSSLMAMSSYSWFFIWMGMEMNLLAFIPFMNKHKSYYSTESSMKYFMVQALASSMLLFSIIMMETNWNMLIFSKPNMLNFLHTSLMLKLGMAPLHSWFPEVSEGLSWNILIWMLTWQKLAPLSMMMMTLNNTFFITTMIILSSIISGLMGLNQISTRKILAYSSINHLSWMIFSMLFSFKIWMIYFFSYLLTNMFIIFTFSKFNISKFNQLNFSNINPFTKMMMMLSILSLSGMPPTMGFFPKWLTIYYSTLTNLQTISVILMMTTMLSIYFYLRMMIPELLLKLPSKKPLYTTNFMNWYILLAMFMILFSLPMMNLLL